MSTRRYYGEEAGGPFQAQCLKCKKWFDSPTGLGCYCHTCRRQVIDALPLDAGDRADAYLECEATPSCGPWVRHSYLRMEEGKDEDEDEDGRATIRIYYRCFHCGQERLYGLQDRK